MIFLYVNKLHSHNARNYDQFALPFAHTSTRLFSIEHFGPRIWNSLRTSSE